jgi:peptide/nickel transport system ATP-binding protein
MLEARDIHFAYPRQGPLFHGLNLEVESHERVALVAPSGAGKSTLGKLLSGYLLPGKGEVLVDGEGLMDSRPCAVQLIWQHPEQAVDPLLRMRASLEEAGPLELGLLDRLGIQRRWLSRRPHELSGGELQRFCIARALSAKPRYVVADEITAMLDAVTQALVWQVLVDECLGNGIGLVFVSHSAALRQRLATRVLEL